MKSKFSPRGIAVLAWGVALAVGQIGAASAQGDKTGETAEAWGSGVVKKSKRPEKGTPLLLIEPKSNRGDVSVIVPDARETVFNAARQGALGARHYSLEAFREAFPGGWKPFYAGAVAAASEHLKSLKPKLVRDKNKVIEYALLHSDHVLTPHDRAGAGFPRDVRGDARGAATGCHSRPVDGFGVPETGWEPRKTPAGAPRSVHRCSVSGQWGDFRTHKRWNSGRRSIPFRLIIQNSKP